MSLFHVYFALLAVLLAIPATAQTNVCGLKISLLCSSAGACTSTTINGPSACTGTIYSGFLLIGNAANTGQLTGFTNSLGLSTCVNSSTTPVPGEKLVICFGSGSLAPNATFTGSVSVTGVSPADQKGIEAASMVIDDSGNQSLVFATPIDPCLTEIHVPPLANSGVPYTITWDPIADTSSGAQYTIVEKDDAGNTISSTTSPSLSQTFTHVVTQATKYHYTVTPTACSAGSPGSSTGTTVVLPPATPVSTSGNPQVSATLGSTQPVSVPVVVSRAAAGQSFTASIDKPYLTVSPTTGTVGANGTTVTVSANPTSLPAGTNTGTLKITTNGTTTTNTPIAVSIVTPVQPGGISASSNALVIPVVTHVNAAAGPFVSDVRLTNASTQPVSYLVTMAPAGADATVASQSTTITVGPQETSALNDIVKNFFGLGATASDTAFGSLQIVPLDATSALNFAASRTYTTQSIGTFGQFIAAIPFSKFATLATTGTFPGTGIPPQPTTKLSLQQVSTSTRFRTNLGLAEGSGQPASGVIRVFDDDGKLVNQAPFNLNPGQVQQQSLGSSLAPSLKDGRIEVEITSPTGAVTAYASVIDNGTTDPFAVAPVDTGSVAATRYVLPGIAELNNATSNFHSDVRIFNAGTSDVNATVNFYPFAGFPGADAKTLSIPAGHIAALDNVLPSFFGVSGTGGSIVVTTPSTSALVTTANTYSNSQNGTFGQFIPGVVPAGGIGAGDRPLQILQLEQSDRFRSNVGLAELTGNPVDLEITLYMPDSKASPVLPVSLAPNEFKQINSIISSFFGQTGQTYNARVAVQVTGGTGRVAAYGSVIDNQSSDPTYVPAQ